MYSKILVPVDLAHLEQLDKALRTAADLARHYGAPVCYVGVTPETPSPVGHNPKEFAERLAAFAAGQAAAYGIEATPLALPATDPATQINALLLRAVEDAGADLVVMASHAPGLIDWILPSHGGSVAAHAQVSVFLVR